jgi:hypothetical protein
MTTRTRDGNGRYIRTIKAVQRDFDAAEMRGKGASYGRIASELGFASRGHAHDAVTRALRDLPYEGAEDDKLLDLDRIDRLIEHSWAVMEREHITVSHGRIVGKQIGWQRDEKTGEIIRDGDGVPVPLYEDLPDDGPGMTAVREIRQLLERRAKIIGYDAPAKSRIEVVTKDVFAAAMADLEARVAANDAADRSAGGTDAPVRRTSGAAAPAGSGEAPASSAPVGDAG